MEYTDEELFEIGYQVGKYERARVARNISRPMDTKTERRTPGMGVREVVPSSRPRDAGKVLHYRWKKDLSKSPEKYRQGYEKGYSEDPKEPMFSPFKGPDYGDMYEVPTTEELLARLPDPDFRKILMDTVHSMKPSGKSKYHDGMFDDLHAIEALFISGKTKWADVSAEFISAFSTRWSISVHEARIRIRRVFNR